MNAISQAHNLSDAVTLGVFKRMSMEKKPQPKDKLFDQALKAAKRTVVSPLWRHDAIVAGVPGRAIHNILTMFSIEQEAVANLLDVTPKTLRNRSRLAHLPAAEGERVLRLFRAWATASIAFEDADYAMEWLREPNEALGGQIPFALLVSADGEDAVLDELAKIEHGLPV